MNGIVHVSSVVPCGFVNVICATAEHESMYIVVCGTIVVG